MLPVDISFIPERDQLGAVVRQMIAWKRAAPLHDLANLFLAKPELYLLKIEPRSAKAKGGGDGPGTPENPVIPAGPDAVTLQIMSAELHGFSAETSISPNILTVVEGGLKATLRPRLAVDTEHGACSIPTSNALFEGVEYFPSLVHVKTDAREFDVEVGRSDLTAINGEHSGYENAIFGEIEVWGGTEVVDGGDEGLDPDYERDFFHAGYQCKEGLAQPVNFACVGFLAPVLAQNAARLSIRTLARPGGRLRHRHPAGGRLRARVP